MEDNALAVSALLMKEREELEDRIRLLEQKQHMEECLPHLYGWPWYQWAWEYFTSTNRYNFLVAANQVSKSTTQIRKCIHWATEPTLWPKLWKQKPTQFWYLYPSLEVATAEWHERWAKELMPRDEYKDHPQYGWEVFFKAKKIHRIEFKSGVTVYFHSYEQDPENLQTSSVYAIFCDEELPEWLYPELNARISAAAIRGYWHMVFTATLGCDLWRCTMEERGTKYEKFVKAAKWSVSLYDCKLYRDGSKSPWTDEAIQDVVDSCSTEAEVERRVKGRFVVDTDKKYTSFSRTKNVKPHHKLPKSWLIYTGTDYGSGGAKGHPAAIVFLAVKPDFTAGRVFKCWRGDGIETTAGDIVDKYVQMRGKLKPVGEYYDHQCRDLYLIGRNRIAYQKADKGQDAGEETVNTLFKLQMLSIYEDDESRKLVLELQALKNSTAKPNAKDDLIDALRFAVMKVPWNFDEVKKKAAVPEVELKTERERYWQDQRERKSGIDLLETEIDLANLAMDYEQDDDPGSFF